jgi:hypothetical protein
MTASLPWFRIYDEALDDPKVQRLPDALFRHWFNLLCLANRGNPRGRLPEKLEDIAYSLRLTPRKTRQVLDELISRGLLAHEENTSRVMPNRWDERQKKSDSSAERVARHRENQEQRNVTEPLLKRNSNALEIEKRREEEIPPLPPEGNDEGKRKKHEYTQEFETLWQEYPPVVNNSKVKAFRAYRNLSKDEQRLARDALPAMKSSDGWRRGFAPHTSTYLNGKLWESKQPDGKPVQGPREPKPPRPPSIEQVLQPRKQLSPEKREEIRAWQQQKASDTSAKREGSTGHSLPDRPTLTLVES